MNEQNTDPTTRQHYLLANKLMQDLGFKWNVNASPLSKENWLYGDMYVPQDVATKAVKNLLESLKVEAS